MLFTCRLTVSLPLPEGSHPREINVNCTCEYLTLLFVFHSFVFFFHRKVVFHNFFNASFRQPPLMSGRKPCKEGRKFLLGTRQEISSAVLPHCPGNSACCFEEKLSLLLSWNLDNIYFRIIFGLEMVWRGQRGFQLSV